jgi:hypothetical protein
MRKRDRRRLVSAIDSQELVRVERKPKYADRLDGFIIAVGAKWALISKTMDGGFFDGYSLFRLSDVAKVSRDKSFEGKFARTQPEWPPTIDFKIDLDGTRETLRDVAEQFPLIGIEKDHERSATWIGEVEELDDKWLWLMEVRPDASWHKRPLGYKLKSITTISVGTHYLQGLSKIAGSFGDA